jgi:hypothetical protein
MMMIEIRNMKTGAVLLSQSVRVRRSDSTLVKVLSRANVTLDLAADTYTIDGVVFPVENIAVRLA